MKIYIGHSTSFNFEQELYAPLRVSALQGQHELIFPHAESAEHFSSKQLFESGCDLMVAEVSFASTGLGIELGWANLLNVPLLLLHKKGTTPSGAVQILKSPIRTYSNPSEIAGLIQEQIDSACI